MEEAMLAGFKKLQVFSILIETDNFWMMKCGFRSNEDGYLAQEIN